MISPLLQSHSMVNYIVKGCCKRKKASCKMLHKELSQVSEAVESENKRNYKFFDKIKLHGINRLKYKRD